MQNPPAFTTCSSQPLGWIMSANSTSSTSKCTRRHIVQAATLTCVHMVMQTICSQPSHAESNDNVDISLEDLTKRSSLSVSLTDFVKLLSAGDVKRAWFFGTFYDTCFFETVSNKIGSVVEGMPVESPKSPESPLQIAAKVRESGVPFYLNPISAKYLKR